MEEFIFNKQNGHIIKKLSNKRDISENNSNYSEINNNRFTINNKNINQVTQPDYSDNLENIETYHNTSMINKTNKTSLTNTNTNYYKPMNEKSFNSKDNQNYNQRNIYNQNTGSKLPGNNKTTNEDKEIINNFDMMLKNYNNQDSKTIDYQNNQQVTTPIFANNNFSHVISSNTNNKARISLIKKAPRENNNEINKPDKILKEKESNNGSNNENTQGAFVTPTNGINNEQELLNLMEASSKNFQLLNNNSNQNLNNTGNYNYPTNTQTFQNLSTYNPSNSYINNNNYYENQIKPILRNYTGLENNQHNFDYSENDLINRNNNNNINNINNINNSNINYENNNIKSRYNQQQEDQNKLFVKGITSSNNENNVNIESNQNQNLNINNNRNSTCKAKVNNNEVTNNNYNDEFLNYKSQMISDYKDQDDNNYLDNHDNNARYTLDDLSNKNRILSPVKDDGCEINFYVPNDFSKIIYNKKPLINPSTCQQNNNTNSTNRDLNYHSIHSLVISNSSTNNNALFQQQKKVNMNNQYQIQGEQNTRNTISSLIKNPNASKGMLNQRPRRDLQFPVPKESPKKKCMNNNNINNNLNPLGSNNPGNNCNLGLYRFSSSINTEKNIKSKEKPIRMTMNAESSYSKQQTPSPSKIIQNNSNQQNFHSNNIDELIKNTSMSILQQLAPQRSILNIDFDKHLNNKSNNYSTLKDLRETELYRLNYLKLMKLLTYNNAELPDFCYNKNNNTLLSRDLLTEYMYTNTCGSDKKKILENNENLQLCSLSSQENYSPDSKNNKTLSGMRNTTNSPREKTESTVNRNDGVKGIKDNYINIKTMNSGSTQKERVNLSSKSKYQPLQSRGDKENFRGSQKQVNSNCNNDIFGQDIQRRLGFLKNIITLANHKMLTSAFREDGKLRPSYLIETNKDLIPLPIPKYFKLSNLNKIDKDHILKAGRSVIQHRRISYGLKCDTNMLTMEDIIYLTRLIMRIQRFWRLFLIKKLSIIIIQSKFRQYLAKNKLAAIRLLLKQLSWHLTSLENIFLKGKFIKFKEQPKYYNSRKTNMLLDVCFKTLGYFSKRQTFIELRRFQVMKKYLTYLLLNKDLKNKYLYFNYWKFLVAVFKQRQESAIRLAYVLMNAIRSNQTMTLAEFKETIKLKTLLPIVIRKIEVWKKYLKNSFYKIHRFKEFYFKNLLRGKILTSRVSKIHQQELKKYFIKFRLSTFQEKIFKLYFYKKFALYTDKLVKYNNKLQQLALKESLERLKDYADKKELFLKQQVNELSGRLNSFSKSNLETSVKELFTRKILSIYTSIIINRLFTSINKFHKLRESLSNAFKNTRRRAFEENKRQSYIMIGPENLNINYPQKGERKTKTNNLNSNTRKINKLFKNKVFDFFCLEKCLVNQETTSHRYNYQVELNRLKNKINFLLQKPYKKFIKALITLRNMSYLSQLNKLINKRVLNINFSDLKIYFYRKVDKENSLKKVVALLKKGFFTKLLNMARLFNKVKSKERGYKKIFGIIQEIKEKRMLLLIRKWKLFIEVKKETYSEYMDLYDDLWKLYVADLDKETKIDIEESSMAFKQNLFFDGGGIGLKNEHSEQNNANNSTKHLDLAKESTFDYKKTNSGIDIFNENQNASKLSIISEFHNKMLDKFSEIVDSQHDDIGSRLIKPKFISKTFKTPKNKGEAARFLNLYNKNL